MLSVHGTGRNRRNTLLLHGSCRLEVTGRWVEAVLHVKRGFMLVLRSKSVEELPSVPNRTRTYAMHIRGSNGPVSECRLCILQAAERVLKRPSYSIKRTVARDEWVDHSILKSFYKIGTLIATL